MTHPKVNGKLRARNKFYAGLGERRRLMRQCLHELTQREQTQCNGKVIFINGDNTDDVFYRVAGGYG